MGERRAQADSLGALDADDRVRRGMWARFSMWARNALRAYLVAKGYLN